MSSCLYKTGGNMTGPNRDLMTKMLSTLKKLKTPSAFAYSAIDSSLPHPALYLPPHGILGLPLSTDDAQKIILQASQSPFGKGEETLIDTTVRRSWELNPNQFSLKNPAWNKAMETILDAVTTGLGLGKRTGKISAKLYKLLLYEPGAFFKPHKDSEKTRGMFATLVVCLPSPHEGGKLVMTHDSEPYEFETASSSSFSFSYAAWYSDITHEVLHVESGYRLMLIYNLIRQTDFKIPSYNLVGAHVKQLSTLLEQYNLQLEEGNDNLPPILLHKLEHKYTQVSLKLNMLKPPDLGQVQTLTQLSTKLGFDIYLGTLVLKVKADDDPDCHYKKKSQNLKMVDLNGKLVKDGFKYPKGALIDPTPQDKGKADREEHKGWTGNEGSPATYWYYNTVVVLVPPSKKRNFVFEFQYNGSVVDPLFHKLMQELSKDQAQEAELKKLCELALKQKPTDCQYSESIPSYFQQAAATALDLGCLDLFYEACKTTCDKIMLDNAHMLGHWAAINGIATMTDRLMKGVQIASSVAKKVGFLKAVAEGFESVVQEPSSAEKASLKQWSDEAIYIALAEVTTLTKADGMSLAQLCKTTDWSQFESKTKPVILKAATMSKITFINELMSTLQQELNEEQRSFIEVIIRIIWNEFVFDVKCPKPVPQMSSSLSLLQSKSCPVKKDVLNANDIFHIVENTITILSSECVETIIIPAMLTAIPTASKECAKELFFSLVQMIVTNELAGFILPTIDTVPPSSHKCFVQALLTKFLLENVSHEPQAPTNWSLPARSCRCGDCWVVNNFLRDSHRESFDFQCGKDRRRHLDQIFTKDSQSTFDVKIIRGKIPNIWRITKHRQLYQMAKSEWLENTKEAVLTLSKFKNDKLVNGRLEAYLQPYYSIIMNADVKELPDLESLVTAPQLSETIENAASTHNLPTNQTGHKRVANHIDLPEDELAKRTRS